MAFLDETGLAYFWNQILARLNKFVPAESGKGLSSNDYTAEEKEKLAGIEVGANKTMVDSTLSATSTNPVQNKVVNTKFETIQAEVDSKVDSIDGKGLSTEDYTTEEKTKLASIAEGAEVNVQADWNEADTSSDAYIVNKPTIPSKTSDLTNDSGFLTSIPDEYVTETELTAKGYLTSYTETDPTVPAWAKQPTKPSYTAEEVGARSSDWMPTAAEVGALPTTYTPPDQTAEQVGADPTGTAASAVSKHNTDETAHNDLRIALQELSDRINAALDSDDTTLDQMSEVVAYIKSNKSLIDAITTSKVNVSDIVNNLTTNVSNKPLSAAQGVALKALIDAITIPTALPNPNALTFTGAVTGTYDGSEAVTVEIPSGGGGSGDIIDVLMDVTIEEAVAAVTVTLDTPRAYKELYIATCVYGDESNSAANAMFLRVNNTGTMGSTNAIAWIPQVENATSAASKSWGIAFVKLLDDCYFYYCYGSKSANGRTPLSSYGEMYTNFNRDTIISTLKFQSVNQWTKFGVGSTIKVYGVRS